MYVLPQETDRRFVVFNNKEVVQEKNNQQVKRLLQTVRGMLATTDSKHFTNPFLLRCEQHVLRHTAHLVEMLEGTLARSGHSVSFFHIQHLQASFYGSIGQGHSVRILSLIHI